MKLRSTPTAGFTGETLFEHKLKSELARFCLPPANRDPNRRLAWVNSICILFLLIGILGAQSIFIPIKPVPPVEAPVPVVVEPVAPPPPTALQPQNLEEDEKNETPQAVAVTLEAPNINFSVPTIGNLLVPAGLAPIPPAQPMNPTPLQAINVSSTGEGGDRPEPTYPQIAKEQGEQGTVTLQWTVDDSGAVTDIEVKDSSGYPILDRSAMDFVKRHWRVPPQGGSHIFTTKIIYVIQLN